MLKNKLFYIVEDNPSQSYFFVFQNSVVSSEKSNLKTLGSQLHIESTWDLGSSECGAAAPVGMTLMESEPMLCTVIRLPMPLFTSSVFCLKCQKGKTIQLDVYSSTMFWLILSMLLMSIILKLFVFDGFW
jgi:hypothetical protein